jgi:hypothetical protein
MDNLFVAIKLFDETFFVYEMCFPAATTAAVTTVRRRRWDLIFAFGLFVNVYVYKYL